MSKQARIKQKKSLSFNDNLVGNVINHIDNYDANLFALNDKIKKVKDSEPKADIFQQPKIPSSNSESKEETSRGLIAKRIKQLKQIKEHPAVKKTKEGMKLLASPVIKFLPKLKQTVIEPVVEEEKPFIVMKNVDVKYNLGKATEYHALKSVSLEIYKGELIIFFGPSGCAKSTLVNVIAGLERPCNGTIEVDGDSLLEYDFDTMADYHTSKTGFVFQAYNLIDSLSVEDNIMLPQMFRDASKKERKKIAQDLMQRFQINEHAKKIPAMLSGGQQQRVGIARALVNDPVIVLADEPIGNLDSASAEIVVEIFKDMSQKDKKTLIMVTHNPDLLPIANRIYYMRDGEIVKEKVNNDIRPIAKKNLEKPKRSKGGDNAMYLEELNITNEMKDILRSFNEVNNDRLELEWPSAKAKIIRKRVLQKYSKEQIESMDEAIRRKLVGLIDSDGLFEILDLSQKKGGCGIDKRLAKKLVLEIDRLIIETEDLEGYLENSKKETKSSREKRQSMKRSQKIIKDLRHQILALYNGSVREEQISKLDRFIRFRLENKINKNRFIQLVSMNVKKGGAGFNRRIARKFAKDLEFLMLIKLGEEKLKQ